MIGLLKQIMATSLYRTGLLGWWWRRRRCSLIVMYHRVLDAVDGCDHSQPGIVVSTPTFERQLSFLRRHFAIVPLATQMPVGRTSTPVDAGDRPFCSITFDDGWADNYRCALPVLKRRQLPSTVFMTTGYIGTRDLFWPERLIYILGSAERRPLRAEVLDGMAAPIVESVLRVARASDDAVGERLDELIELLKGVDVEPRESLLEALCGATGRNPAALAPRMLDWPAVRELAAAGVEIGSHGVSHNILPRVDPARAAGEILESRARLHAATGTPPTSFAYPNGEWSPALVEQVREAGYERAVATDSGWAGDDHFPYAVARLNLAEGSSRGWRGYSEAIFACEVWGLFDALRRLGGRR